MSAFQGDGGGPQWNPQGYRINENSSGRNLHGDTQYLRDYITAQDKTRYDQLPQGLVSVHITHSNLKTIFGDIRLDLHAKISEIKHKIYTHCGTKPHFQKLTLKNSSGMVLAPLDDDNKMLGYYGVESGMDIHVTDEDPFSMSANGGFEDVSKIKKYQMTEEEYDQRDGTLRSWIKEQKAKDPNWVAPWNQKGSSGGPAGGGGGMGGGNLFSPSNYSNVSNMNVNNLKKTETEPFVPPGIDSIQGMKVGDRCETQPGARRGTIMFLGETEGILQEGYWVGVKFDEPLGRNNGTVKGKQFFECMDKFGSFVRPKNVTVGDYPEIDLLDDSDEDEI